MDQQISAVIVNRKENKLKVRTAECRRRTQTGLSLTEQLDDKLSLAVCVLVAERLWLPPGPAGGGGDAGCVLHHGPAVVRGGDRALHLPRQQSETGVGVRGAGRAAKVPGHQRAESHGLHDLRPDGLLRLHDLRPQGEHHHVGLMNRDATVTDFIGTIIVRGIIPAAHCSCNFFVFILGKLQQFGLGTPPRLSGGRLWPQSGPVII